MLEAEFPECKIGYSYRADHVTWSSQVGHVLNADGPDALRGAVGVGRRRACLRSGCGALTCDYFSWNDNVRPSSISMK
jgi:hypothetical protein